MEVTKLSLLLKCMEGETGSSINAVMRFRERVLPTLDDNIKSGNSLIDVDFYDTEFDFGEEKKIKPFNWQQGFPNVFKHGGFDVVIGNPPWGADFVIASITYIRSRYISATTGSFDSYALFIEKGLRILNKGGLLGFITPDTFLRKDDFLSFRDLIFDNYTVKELAETGPVFSKVRDTWCCVINIEKKLPLKTSTVVHKKVSRFIVSAEERLQKFALGQWDACTNIQQKIWQSRPRKIIGYRASKHEQEIINKVEGNTRLGDLKQFKISRGEEGSKFNILETENGDYFMVIPEDIEKYFVSGGKKIKSKSLTSNKVKFIYSHPKIWIIRIQKMRWLHRIVSAVDTRTNTAGMKTLQSITSEKDNLDDLFYLQAILGSELINFWCVNYLSDDINQSYLEKIPISISDMQLRTDIIKMVQGIMQLNKEKQQTTLPQKLEQLNQRIAYTDDKINKLVYQLYGLTEEEIKIVEGRN